MFYTDIKTAHVVFADVSIGLFALRFYWSLAAPDRLTLLWVRVVPHANDTLLLACALYLMVATGQYPVAAPWLTAKLAALGVYIALGSVALKRARSLWGKWLSAGAALAVFAYIVAVAVTHKPVPV